MANETHQYKLNFDTNANQAAGDVNKLGQSIDKTKKATDDLSKSNRALDKTFEEVYGDLQPLTTRMGEAEDRLYELALAGQQATEEFQQLLTVVANYRATQIATDAVVDVAAQTLGGKLATSAQFAATTVSALESGMALFGITSEDTQKQLLKVQAALSFADSIGSLTEQWRKFKTVLSESNILTKANAAANTVAAGTMKLLGISVDSTSFGFKALKSAIAATGIGLAIVALGELYANFDKVKSVIGIGASEEEKAAEKAKTARAKYIEGLQKQLDLEGATMSEAEKKNLETRIKYAQLGSDNEEKANAEIKKLNEQFFSSLIGNTEEYLKASLEARKEMIETLGQGVTDFIQGFGKLSEIKELQDKVKQINTLKEQVKKDNQNIRESEKAEQDAAAKEEQDKRDKAAKERRDKLLAYYKQIGQITLNANRAFSDLEDESSTERLRRQKSRDLEALEEIKKQGQREGLFTLVAKEKYENAKLAIGRKYANLAQQDAEDIVQAAIEGQEKRDIANQKFNASIIQDDIKRLEAQKDIIDKEYQNELRGLQLKRDVYEIGSKEYAAYQQKILDLTRNYNQDISTNNKDTTKAQKDADQRYRDFVISQTDVYFEDRYNQLLKDQDIIKQTEYGNQKDKVIALATNYQQLRELDDAYVQYQANIALNYAGALSDIGNLFSDYNEKHKDKEKAGIIITNAAGAASVVINTLVANSKATAELGVLAPPVIAANFVSMAASLAKMIQATGQALAKIGRGGSADSGVGASAAATATQQPNVSFVASSGNQLAQTIAGTKQGPDTIKAFVVSADITTAQSLDANKISATSI